MLYDDIDSTTTNDNVLSTDVADKKIHDSNSPTPSDDTDVTVEEDVKSESVGANIDGERCVICLDVDGDLIRRDGQNCNCSVWFHPECLEAYDQMHSFTGGGCPMCRDGRRSVGHRPQIAFVMINNRRRRDAWLPRRTIIIGCSVLVYVLTYSVYSLFLTSPVDSYPAEPPALTSIAPTTSNLHMSDAALIESAILAPP